MGKYHNILYIALKICWDWGVKDSATVAALLGKQYINIYFKIIFINLYMQKKYILVKKLLRDYFLELYLEQLRHIL